MTVCVNKQYSFLNLTSYQVSIVHTSQIPCCLAHCQVVTRAPTRAGLLHNSGMMTNKPLTHRTRRTYRVSMTVYPFRNASSKDSGGCWRGLAFSRSRSRSRSRSMRSMSGGLFLLVGGPAAFRLLVTPMSPGMSGAVDPRIRAPRIASCWMLR